MEIFELQIDKNKLHQKFKIIKDCLAYTGEQQVLKDWIKGFIDRDNKIVKEFQESFHSSFWEFYLFAVFKEAGFEVDFTKNRPDFIIKTPLKLYIEAVVANIKQDGKKEEERTLDDILSMLQPVHLDEKFNEKLNESVTRYFNSIQCKYKKYNGYYEKSKYKKGYIEDDDFDKDTPYIIALSGYEQINYGNNFYYAMFALLYGLFYDNLNDKYEKKEYILKPGTDSKLEIGLFLNDQMKELSAIIFSSTVTLGKLTSLAISQDKSPLKINAVLCIRHDIEPPYFKPQLVSQANPEYLSDGLFIFHNPFAKNKLPNDSFKNTNAINIYFDIEKKHKIFEGNNLPIVSRLNLAGGESFFKNNISKIIESFNPDIFFVFAKVLDFYSIDEQYEVSFIDLETKIEFQINFQKEQFEQYQMQEDKKFMFTFQLQKEEFNIKSIQQFELLKKINKLKCLSFGEGFHIIDIQEV
jgi:hypothetical protein